MIDTPCETEEWTVVDPPKTDCVAMTSALTSIASVINPELHRTAKRPPISLPRAEEEISTALGLSFSTTA